MIKIAGNIVDVVGRNIKKEILYLNLDDDKTFILDFRKKNYQYLFDLGYKTTMETKII